MSHVRTQLRHAIAAALRERTEFAKRVFDNQRGSLAEDEIPAAIIRTPNEQTECLADDRKEREQTVTIEVQSGHLTPPDDLDELCVAVEIALDGQDLGGLVTLLELVSTEIDFTRDDAVQVGSALMTFVATLHTAVGDPENSI